MAENSLIRNLGYKLADTCLYAAAGLAVLNLSQSDQTSLPGPAQVLVPAAVAGVGILIYGANLAYDFVTGFKRSVKPSGLERILETPDNK